MPESEIVHLPNVSFVTGNVSVNLNLSGLEKNFSAAQQWLGDRVLEDCRAVMPLLTGNLTQRSHTINGGRQVVFPGPTSRFLYMGKVMVDPETRSPFARRGVKKVVTDKPLSFSRPGATDHWFDTAKAMHKKDWIEGARRVLLIGGD